MATKTAMKKTIPESTKRVTKGRTKPNAGAMGHALALSVLAVATEVGEFLRKTGISMKGRLKELVAMPRDSHLEFRAVLEARRLEIEKEAEKAKITISAYRDANSIDDSLYVTISLWNKLSKAVEAGWKPDYDKPWNDISKAATQYLDHAKAKAAQAKLSEAVKENKKAAKEHAAKGDMKMAEVFEKKAELLTAEIKATPITAAPTTKRGRPESTMHDKVFAIIKDRPIQDVERLTAHLVVYLMDHTKHTLAKTLEELRDAITKGNIPTSETTVVIKGEKAGVSGQKEKAAA